MHIRELTIRCFWVNKNRFFSSGFSVNNYYVLYSDGFKSLMHLLCLCKSISSQKLKILIFFFNSNSQNHHFLMPKPWVLYTKKSWYLHCTLVFKDPLQINCNSKLLRILVTCYNVSLSNHSSIFKLKKVSYNKLTNNFGLISFLFTFLFVQYIIMIL